MNDNLVKSQNGMKCRHISACYCKSIRIFVFSMQKEMVIKKEDNLWVYLFKTFISLNFFQWIFFNSCIWRIEFIWKWLIRKAFILLCVILKVREPSISIINYGMAEDQFPRVLQGNSSFFELHKTSIKPSHIFGCVVLHESVLTANCNFIALLSLPG